MDVTPFRGLRPRPDLAARIPSLPYDVLDSDEARRLAADDPYSFLHVVKAEIDLDPAIDPYDERVYRRARENFDGMRNAGWLVRDASPAFYLYRQTMGGHVQTGVLGAASVDDYLSGRIKRHEHTRPDKEDDRTRHATALAANAGPVFLAYRESRAVDEIVAAETRHAPAASFEAPDGIGHTLWVVDAEDTVARLTAALRELPATYISDGHHRAAAYARVSQDRRSGGRFLAAHFPAAQLRILDYNRVVRDLNGLEPAGFLLAVQDAGFRVVAPWPEMRPPRAGTFGVYLAGEWRLLEAAAGTVPTDDPVRSLDVSILQDRILAPILGIGDPRTDSRITFVGGIRGLAELERRVGSSAASVAFALHPTGLGEVMRVADAGKVMPPKSTWFEPKLRSGLVVLLLDES